MAVEGASRTAVGELARALQDLRRSAGNPSFNDLAKVTGVPRSTLHDAVSGKRMPSQKVTVTLASALGGDAAEWHDRWVVTDRARHPDASEPAPEPSDSTPVRPSWLRRNRVAVVVAVVLVVAAAILVPLVLSQAGSCTQVRDYVVTEAGAVLDEQGVTVGQVGKGDHLHVASIDHKGRFAHRRFGVVQPHGVTGYVDESKLDFTGLVCG